MKAEKIIQHLCRIDMHESAIVWTDGKPAQLNPPFHAWVSAALDKAFLHERFGHERHGVLGIPDRMGIGPRHAGEGGNQVAPPVIRPVPGRAGEGDASPDCPGARGSDRAAFTVAGLRGRIGIEQSQTAGFVKEARAVSVYKRAACVATTPPTRLMPRRQNVFSPSMPP